MKFFVDTNVIVDLIGERAPFNELALKIFNRAEAGKIELYTSSHAIVTVHYLIKKFIKESELRNILLELLDLLKIVGVSEDILKKSLKSNHRDFEDAIQILCAHQVKNLDAIITRNLKDFSTSEIRVLSPEEVIKFI